MMNPATTNALATTATEIPAILMEVLESHHLGLSRRTQYDIVRTQIAPGCDDNELALFLTIAKSRGLDVFAKQIYARKQNVWNSEKRTTESKMILITSIDGFRLKAARTKEHTKTDDAEFTYDEKRVSPLNPAGIVKCRVVVYRNDRPFPATVFWDEMRQSYKKDNIERLNSTWEKMPHAMAGKCAESLALRKAFPEELSNISVDDEVSYEAPTPAAAAVPPTVSVPAILPANVGTATTPTVIAKEVKPDVDWAARVTEAETLLRACVDQVQLAEAFKKLSTLLPKGKAPAEARQRVGALFAEFETKFAKVAEMREPGVEG